MAERNSGPGPPVRIGVIGCGRIAQSYLEILSNLSSAELSAVADLRVEAAKAAAEYASSLYFTDYLDQSLVEAVDAVLICTPPNTHHEIGRWFLSQKKAVLLEKPLTLAAAEAEDLEELSRKQDCLLMMASKFRYLEDIVKAKVMLESGLIGRAQLAEITFASRVDMKDRWNSNPEISGGGVLIDHGAHAVDIVRFLLGPIVEVNANSGPDVQGLGVEDSVRLGLHTTSGVLTRVDLTWSFDKPCEHFLSIYGNDGLLQVGWQGSRYRDDGRQGWTDFGSGYDKSKAIKRQLMNFIDAIRHQQLPRITAQDALASVQVIDAAYASLGDEGRWTSVKGIDDRI